MAHDRGLNQRTFRRGLRELLESNFCIAAPATACFYQHPFHVQRGQARLRQNLPFEGKRAASGITTG